MISAAAIKVFIANMTGEELAKIVRENYPNFTPEQRYKFAQEASRWHDRNPKEFNPFAALSENKS